MKPDVYIYFNGEECTFPPDNAWEKFTGLDTARVFAMCAHSWERAGWNVKRLVVEHRHFPRICDTGSRINENHDSFSWYPSIHWGFLNACAEVASDTEWTVFATFDVLNFNLDRAALVSHLKGVVNSTFVNFQKEHLSLSCFMAKRDWLIRANRLLEEYDLPNSPYTLIRSGYVSDERICREYMDHYDCPIQCFATDPAARRYPLVHFARSTLARIFHETPTQHATEKV